MGILMCSCEAEVSAGEGDTLGPPVSPGAPTPPLCCLCMRCASVISSLSCFSAVSCFLETHSLVDD